MVGLLKFFLGFCLGIMILAGGAGLTAYYLFTKTSIAPPRPTFPEEIEKKDKNANKNQKKNNQNSTNNKNTTSNQEPGLYKGKIIPEQGVTLREKPNVESSRIGGIMGNATVIVLEENEEKTWLRIRNEQGDQSGWIRARSLEKL